MVAIALAPASRAASRASVTRTHAGYEASFGALPVGVYASEELAWRSLDILCLKSGQDAGLPLASIQLRHPLEGYLDPRTKKELLSYDLPAIVAAVRSFAVGGAHAPRCAVVDGPTPASAGGDLAAADELVAWRGVTREAGRQQAYISLLYAALDADKRPLPPAGRSKLSVYVASSSSPRLAAVAHDVSVVWYQLTLAGQGGAGGPAAPAQAWERDAAVLKQLNFESGMYTGDEALMRQLAAAKSLPDLRSILVSLRSSGSLAQMAEASRALRPSVALGAVPARLSASRLGASRRKAGAGWGRAPRRVPAASLPSPVEPGKHGRLHQASYMGLVRDRQITLHPWRPMICTAVEGRSKPQPRSLTSCATAQEAAVARDLGWIWLWGQRNQAQRPATLNFALKTYAKHGGSLLTEVGALPSLEALRGFLRRLRDSGRLLSLATTLEHELGAPRPTAPTGAGHTSARTGDSAVSRAGEGLDEEAEAAAEEMLHLLGADGGSGGSGGGARAAASDAEQTNSGGSEEAWEGGGSGSDELESESSEDAGAVEDSEDEEWRARALRAAPPRKRPRVVPPEGAAGGLTSPLWGPLAVAADQPTPVVGTPLGGGSRPAQQQQQQQQQQAEALGGSLRRTPSAGAGSDVAAAGGTPFVGVQRVTGPKASYQSTKVWIPRPTVRVPGPEGWMSKQLTLCYMERAEEAALARDLITLWSCHRVATASGAAAQAPQAPRLNWPLARFQEQTALMQRLRGIATAAGVQELAKELRDGGTLRSLAAAWTAAASSSGQALPQAAAAAEPHEPPAGNLLAALEAAAEKLGAEGASEGQGGASGALSPSSR